MKSKKKILVTGGTGFIGSHLCERLLEEGNTVFCLDNFFTGPKSNVSHLLKNPKFRVIKHDVVKPFPKIKVDKIYSLACPASPIHYQIDPIKTIETSVIGVSNVLKLAQKIKARVLQASTSEVYGDPHVHPQKESYWGNVNPIGPRACYDEGKRAAETLCVDYHKECGVDIRIARIFNTYGPKMQQNDGRAVSNFIVQALKAEPITIYGNGSQTRSFCYVTDMVSGLIKLMESDYVAKPVNIGNPHEVSIKEIAEKIVAMTSSKSKITFKLLPEDDPKKRQPDISTAKEVLDWLPLIALDDGLETTIAYFRKLLRINNEFNC